MTSSEPPTAAWEPGVQAYPAAVRASSASSPPIRSASSTRSCWAIFPSLTNRRYGGQSLGVLTLSRIRINPQFGTQAQAAGTPLQRLPDQVGRVFPSALPQRPATPALEVQLLRDR